MRQILVIAGHPLRRLAVAGASLLPATRASQMRRSPLSSGSRSKLTVPSGSVLGSQVPARLETAVSGGGAHALRRFRQAPVHNDVASWCSLVRLPIEPLR